MKLLKLEYKKIIGNKSFWVFTLLFLVLLPFLVIFIPGSIGMDFEGVEFYPFIPRNYEITWYYVTIVSSWFSFFLLNFILIYHVTNEYTYRTVRQNVIDGLTRTDYLKGKLLLLLVISILATAYVFLVGLIGGMYFSSFTPPEPNVIQKMFSVTISAPGEFGQIWDGVGNVFRFFIQNTATFCFAILVAFLVKRGILAILIFYSSFIIEYIIGKIMYSKGLEDLYEYLPLQSIGDTLPFPGFKQLLLGIAAPSELSWINMGVVFIYILVFLFLIKRIFFKRDIS